MTPSTRLLARLAVASVLALLAMSVGATAARADTRCGILSTAGHSWIVVTKGVPCSTALRITRGYAVRTAAMQAGQTRLVSSPIHGFRCLLSNRGQPAGGCVTPGNAKSILWIVAA
jgi:hypothetical protein